MISIQSIHHTIPLTILLFFTEFSSTSVAQLHFLSIIISVSFCYVDKRLKL